MIPKPEYIIPRERQQDLVPEIWNSISQTGDVTKKWHGVNILGIRNFYIDRKCFCIYEKKDWDKVTKFVANRLIKEPAYFKKVWQLHNTFGSKAEEYARATLNSFDNVDQAAQLQALRALKEHWLQFDQINVLPWFLGAETLREYIQDQLVKLGVTYEELETLWAANTLSLAAQEELALHRAVLAYQSKKDVKRLASKLSEDFGWIPFGYDGPTFWDTAFYRRKISSLKNEPPQELKAKIIKIKDPVRQTLAKQKKIILKRRIPQSLIRLLDIQQKLYIMTDERKKITFQIHYVYHELLKKLSKVSGLTLPELKYLETAKVLEMFDRKAFQKYKKIAEQRIKYPLHVYYSRGRLRSIECGKEVGKKLYKFVVESSDISEFTGMAANIASDKLVQGRVRRILNSREVGKMKKGEVLVTAMTTPDFVQAMRIAKAIVTDEGGITSHAAIVSRELGVTCIIGTKIATQVLQDGDLVEIDSTKGIIRKLS